MSVRRGPRFSRSFNRDVQRATGERSTLRMKIYAYGQKGPDKTIGEDCMMVGNGILSEGFMEYTAVDKVVLAVSDGVGGNNAGEEASLLALKGLREARLFEGCDQQKLEETIKRINQDILTFSRVNDAYTDMAATLTGIYVEGDKCLAFHVGNTRIYVVNNGEFLRQLTRDHTNVNKWVKMGIMTREEAQNHPDRNIIYGCVGGGNAAFLEALEVMDISRSVQGGRPIVLTSDGVHDHVSVDEMEKILLGEGSVKEKLELLAQQARAYGSVDDISIIYFDRKKEEEETIIEKQAEEAERYESSMEKTGI